MQGKTMQRKTDLPAAPEVQTTQGTPRTFAAQDVWNVRDGAEDVRFTVRTRSPAPTANGGSAARPVAGGAPRPRCRSMSLAAQRHVGLRRRPTLRTDLAAVVAGLCLAVLSSAAANAQRLWSVGEVERRPEMPAVVMEGAVVAVSGLPGGFGRQLPSEVAEIMVEFDYLRLGMGYLELPLMDGSVIAADNAVFEDRGGGNLMWTGEVPGAGYESVVLTVQDGHLVGWFGEPGGPKYIVHAGPDGRGTLAVETGPAGDWCGADAAQETVLGASAPESGSVGSRAAAAARDHGLPGTVASAAAAARLDILVLYPSGTEWSWRRIGGVAVGIQQLADYLNMAFRNGEIPVTASLIPVRWDPRTYSPLEAHGSHYYDGGSLWHWEFDASPEVDSLRRRHEPDLIHFVPHVGTIGIFGRAFLRDNSGEPAVLTGWSVPTPSVFAHEIGHNLGGHHEPATFRDFEAYRSSAVEWGWPWMFGHTDMTSCSEREGDYYLYCPATIMSYGQDAARDDDPRTEAVGEPFYSSVRHRPNGWKIGVAGTSEVERVLHETVSVAAVSGAAPWKAEQVPRRIGARWIGRDTLRVSWSEDLSYAGEVVAHLALVEGANDDYVLGWKGSDPLDRQSWSDDNMAPVVRSDGALVGVDIAGLRPGGRYRIAGWAPSRSDPDTGKTPASLDSDVFHLRARERASGTPAAATRVGIQATGPDSIRLRWRDNSRAETGYEVWYRKWSGGEPDQVWRRHGKPLPAGARYVDVGGLAADEIVLTGNRWVQKGPRDWRRIVETAMRGRYSFVVVAYNDRGWNASETFDMEFMPGPHPAEPTAAGELTNCFPRDTGINLDGHEVRACVETPDGARRRAWDYRLDGDRSALLYFFDRDNVEILVKVLDGCAINGHRWVFVAPVTELSFRLSIYGGGVLWWYDSMRRPQEQIDDFAAPSGNPKGMTARTVSDNTAFPCSPEEIAAARSAADSGFGGVDLAEQSSPTGLGLGSGTDCEPAGPALTLRGGYTVSMCYETYEGRTGDARDWGLDSSQSALLYFFDRDNVEVLIKVLDGCGINRHRWIFAAPVTDLAFNLHVESPTGERWTHRNRLGQTADTAADVWALPCASSA